MIQQIEVEGSAILREIAEEVPLADIPSLEVQQVIDDLLHTLRSTTGVGLAAPQISKSLRIVVVDKPMTVLINPVVTPVGDEKTITFEGCLSVPGMRGDVERPRTVRVQYYDRKGRAQDTTWTQFRAVVVQHEVDHLNGILYTERADAMVPDGAVHTPPSQAAPKAPERNVSGTKKTFVVDSGQAVRGRQQVTLQFHECGRVVGIRLQPGGAIVTGVWLSGVRQRSSGYKAGAAQLMLLGKAQSLHVASGDQLRIEFTIERGAKRILCEADFDSGSLDASTETLLAYADENERV